MSILLDVAKELVGMFLADARLTTATLLLVGVVAGLLFVLHADPLIGAAVLLFGCLLILIEASLREARRRRR